MKIIKNIFGWGIVILISCAMSFLLYKGQDVSSIHVILDEKFEGNYEVTEWGSGAMNGRNTKVLRVISDEHQYIMHFKHSGNTTFSDHELVRMESVKTIPLD